MFRSDAYDQATMRLRQPARAGTRNDLELVRLATLAASSHNTQPWRFRLGEGAISILPDRTRRCPVVDPKDAHLYRSLGCAAENLAHAASLQGYAASVDYDDRADAVVVALEADGDLTPTELSAALHTRQSTRGLYDGTPVPTEHLDVLRRAGAGDGVRCLLVSDPSRVRDLTTLVERGNTAQLTDRAFRQELLSWIRFNPYAALRSRDGLSGRATGQPPLPTLLARVMSPLVVTAAAQNRADRSRLESSAAVAVFLAREHGRSAWVEAGRAYERFALQAELLDIRSAFVNQPIEVPSLRPELQSVLGVTEDPQLMVRIGHGPRAPYSLRRPPHDVLAD